MKKLLKMSLLVLVPLVSGLVLLFVGGYTENETFTEIGNLILKIGMPVTIFILVVVGLILMMTGRLADKNDYKTKKIDYKTNETDDLMLFSDNDEEIEQNGKSPSNSAEEEFSDLEEINSTYHYDNYKKYGEYMSRHSAANFKNSSTKEKILGLLFFAFLMVDFALILVFGFMQITAGAIACFCIFGGTIITVFIVKLILEKSSLDYNFKNSDKKLIPGEVKACFLSSSRGFEDGYKTTRITKVVYKVIITADGEDYKAYSRKFYETGDSVQFAVIGKKRAAILEEETE